MRHTVLPRAVSLATCRNEGVTNAARWKRGAHRDGLPGARVHVVRELPAAVHQPSVRGRLALRAAPGGAWRPGLTSSRTRTPTADRIRQVWLQTLCWRPASVGCRPWLRAAPCQERRLLRD